eukprot:COSAG01_NODE_25808_length_732_cov_1.470774_1_plen_58_part_01
MGNRLCLTAPEPAAEPEPGPFAEEVSQLQAPFASNSCRNCRRRSSQPEPEPHAQPRPI